jgi:hypothetical protein
MIKLYSYVKIIGYGKPSNGPRPSKEWTWLGNQQYIIYKGSCRKAADSPCPKKGQFFGQIFG